MSVTQFYQLNVAVEVVGQVANTDFRDDSPLPDIF